MGEDVETYVTRAVARQMVAEQRRVSSESLEELLAHLADFGVFGEASTPSIIASITDPDRLRALHDTGLLDSPFEAVYARITRAAAEALGALRAAVSLV